ncbi:MAG: alpha/beta hydrolase [Hyphomicrobiaceae bacterium]
MTALDLEAEYYNRRRVPEHPDIQSRWKAATEAWLKDGKVEPDLVYGKGERNRYDLYRAASGGTNAAIVVYIHGGYWQRGDRKDNGFVAKQLNLRGVSVALPSYSLCPAVGVIDIISELRQCLAAIWQRTRQRLVVVGHSAGGHLAASMLATDWSKVDGVPSDLVKAAYAISGIFELSPLLPTSINEALKLDPAKAREASPLFWSPPPKGCTFVAAAGGDESQEFFRQALEITAAWSKAGVRAECVIVPQTNHFTVVEELARPDSAMLQRIAAMSTAGV